MKKIFLILVLGISYLSAEINEYLSDVYFANGIDTTREQAYLSKDKFPRSHAERGNAYSNLKHSMTI